MHHTMFLMTVPIKRYSYEVACNFFAFDMHHNYDFLWTVPMERVVINKERAAGWYRLSAYYCAKMTSELPLTLLQPLFFVVVSYWIIGLNGISAFFATIGTIFINSIAGQVQVYFNCYCLMMAFYELT